MKYMSDSLLKLIEEQLAFEFNGKIDVLESKSKQYLGAVYIRSGTLLNVQYAGQIGIKALFLIYLRESKLNDLHFIVEPEIVDEINQNIHYPYKVLVKKLSEYFEEYKKSSTQRPPANIKVLINGDFISKGLDIDQNEYSLLCTISDYSLVEDIYKNSQLFEHEITIAFVSLRKKGALKVI